MRFDEYGNQIVARWDSKTGKHWVIATVSVPEGYGGYKSPSAGGSTGTLGAEATIAEVERKVKSGYFLPDSAKTPMHLSYRYEPQRVLMSCGHYADTITNDTLVPMCGQCYNVETQID
jgi:hypothetical protein